MKQCMRWSLSVVAVGALLAVSAFAQDQAEGLKAKFAANVQSNIEIAKPLGSQFSFETKVVKGAPYSATAEAETIQMLADSNRIRSRTTRVVYRDREGRTRREASGKTPGVPAQVFINDPVSNVSYALDVQRRIAVKSPGNLQTEIMIDKRGIEKRGADQKAKSRTEGFKPPITIDINGQVVRWEQLDEEHRARIEAKMRAAKEVKPSEKPAPAGGDVTVEEKTATRELLGQQMIEGVLCEGKRTTVMIPANSIGNDLPISIVSEEWYSPELQVLVLTKQSDPRYGETIYRLTNINRSEQARALFEVPSDYTVRENNLPMKAKPTREEQ